MVAGNFSGNGHYDGDACVMRFRGIKGGGFELQIEFGELGGGRLAAVREPLSIRVSKDEARKLLRILKAQVGGRDDD